MKKDWELNFTFDVCGNGYAHFLFISTFYEFLFSWRSILFILVLKSSPAFHL